MNDQSPVAAWQRIVVNLGDKPLAYKIDLVTALLVAVRDGHREEMTPSQWHELNCALAHLCAAMESGGAKQAVRTVPVCTRWHHHMLTLKEGEPVRPALPGGLSPLEQWLERNPPRLK